LRSTDKFLKSDNSYIFQKKNCILQNLTSFSIQN